MLAITERLIIKAGLDWAFCDTDSMAIAKPAGMDQKTFFAKAKSIADWFTPLNPYEIKGPLLKIEDVNRAIGSKELVRSIVWRFHRNATRCSISMRRGSLSFARPQRTGWGI